MIIITGAAGFIGSYLTKYLNRAGHTDLILVDEFSHPNKNRNLAGKKYLKKMERDPFPVWFEKNTEEIDFVLHIGARTDTTEFDRTVFDRLNIRYSQKIWKICTEFRIPLIYASSAATYGMGEYGFSDSHEIVPKLRPLNPYGESKNEFDKWVLGQEEHPPFWAGLKFFNIYGPNEFHKRRMASVIFHAFRQIQETGSMKLFQSHHPDFKDGEQKRDFCYVKDVAKVCIWLMENQPDSGLYNLGTGRARTFLDLVRSTFAAMEISPDIRFIPTPEDIRNKYQYFTEAEMQKLRAAGYRESFIELEEGVQDYVRHYLIPERYF